VQNFLLAVGIMSLVPIVGVLVGFGLLMGRAGTLGFRSTREYLRAAPRSDEERRDAADLAMKGLVICMLGFIFPTLVLAGLVPLFYGGRKLAYASMGLGLVDDSNQHEV
jgi:hypothetical protein